MRPGSILLASLIATVLWVLLTLGADSPLLAAKAARDGVELAAYAFTGIAVVLAAGQAVLYHIAASGVSPTGLQRVLIYAVLTFVVSTTILYLLHFDLSAVLATSALLTAGVGFAM